MSFFLCIPVNQLRKLLTPLCVASSNQVIGLSPSTIPSAMAADNLAMAAYLAVLMSVPVSNIVRHASISLRQSSLVSRVDQQLLSSIAVAAAGPSITAASEPQLVQHISHLAEARQVAEIPNSTGISLESESAVVQTGNSAIYEAHSGSSSGTSSVSDIVHHGIPPGMYDSHSVSSSNKYAHNSSGNSQDRTVTHNDIPLARCNTSNGSLQDDGSSIISSSDSSSSISINSSSLDCADTQGSLEDQPETVTMSANHLSVIFAAAAFSCASAQHIAAALFIPSLSMLVMAGVATCVSFAAQQYRWHSGHGTGATLPPSIFAGGFLGLSS